MAKKRKIEFSLKDGCAPKKEGGLLKLGLPFSLLMKAGDDVVLDLGIHFLEHVMLLEHPLMTRYGVTVKNAGKVFRVGESLIVHLESLAPPSSAPVQFERGDSVVFAVVFSDDFEI